MIEKIPVISFIVFAVWYTMQPKEIFGWLGNWFEKHTPSWMHQPLFDCVNCMTIWYGSIFYWLIPWDRLHMPTGSDRLSEWAVVVIAAFGLNVILTKLFPPDDPGPVN